MNREMGVPYEARVSRPPTRARLPAGQQIPAVETRSWSGAAPAGRRSCRAL